MAISWTTKITNVNIASKRADVSFTRTDDVTGDTWTKSFSNDMVETDAQRLTLCDQTWTAWQLELSKQTDISTLITNLEQAGNANLMAREV